MRVYDPFYDLEAAMRLAMCTATPNGERYSAVSIPYVEMLDREGEVVITVDLPGIDKRDIKLDVRENNLIIEAERKRGKMASLKLRKTVRLPGDVDASSASATMNNGVLEIKLPKAAKRRTPIRID